MEKLHVKHGWRRSMLSSKAYSLNQMIITVNKYTQEELDVTMMCNLMLPVAGLYVLNSAIFYNVFVSVVELVMKLYRNPGTCFKKIRWTNCKVKNVYVSIYLTGMMQCYFWNDLKRNFHLWGSKTNAYITLLLRDDMVGYNLKPFTT